MSDKQASEEELVEVRSIPNKPTPFWVDKSIANFDNLTPEEHKVLCRLEPNRYAHLALEQRVTQLEEKVDRMSPDLARLVVAGETTVSSKRNCPACGRATQENATHCHLCGAALPTP